MPLRLRLDPIWSVPLPLMRERRPGFDISFAQRVMDCGDAGHILLSKHVADDIDDYPEWRPHLHDLGECEVKHGVTISVVNLYTDWRWKLRASIEATLQHCDGSREKAANMLGISMATLSTARSKRKKQRRKFSRA